MKGSVTIDIDSGVTPAACDAPAWHGYSAVASERVKVLKYIPEASVMCAGTILPTVFAFDVDTSEGLWSVTPPGVFGAVRALDVHKGVLVCGFDDCAIRVYRFSTRKHDNERMGVDYRIAPIPGAVLLNAHLDYIRSCLFQPICIAAGEDDGDASLPPMLLTASDDQTVRSFVWEGSVSSPQLKPMRVMAGHTHYVMGAVWLSEPPLADGAAAARCAVSASLDASLRVWDVLSGKLLASCSGLHNKRGINHVAVHRTSHDSERHNTKWLVASGGDDCCVTLLRIERSGAASTIMYVLSRLTTHQRSVTAVMFIPPSAAAAHRSEARVELLSASEDGSMHTYEVPIDVAQGDVVVCSRQPFQSNDEVAASRQWSLCPVGSRNRIAVGHDKGVHVVTDTAIRSIARLGRAPTAFVSLPDGGDVVDHTASLVALRSDNSSSDAAARGAKRVSVHWVLDDRWGTYAYLLVCLTVILVNIMWLSNTLFTMEATGARLKWSDVFVIPWWNWLLIALATPCLMHVVLDMTLVSTIDLELARSDLKGPWTATVGLSWTTLRSIMLRRRSEGSLRFRLDGSVKFYASLLASSVGVEVPLSNVENAELHEKRFFVKAAKEGVCACGGQHKLVDRYRVPFVQRRLFSSTTCSSHQLAQRERMRHLQWTTLANAIAQQSNTAIAFLGIDL